MSKTSVYLCMETRKANSSKALRLYTDVCTDVCRSVQNCVSWYIYCEIYTKTHRRHCAICIPRCNRKCKILTDFEGNSKTKPTVSNCRFYHIKLEKGDRDSALKSRSPNQDPTSLTISVCRVCSYSPICKDQLYGHLGLLWSDTASPWDTVAYQNRRQIVLRIVVDTLRYIAGLLFLRLCILS